MTPDLKARFEAEGSAVSPMTPERFEQFVRAEVAKYARLIKATGTILD